MRRALAAALLGCLAAATAACGPPDDGPALQPPATPPQPVVSLPDEPGSLPAVHSAPVHGRSGPGERSFDVTLRTTGQAGHYRRFGTRTLPTAFRGVGIEKYPCTSCHIPGQRAVRAERSDDAHQNIQPLHPAETGAACATCHVAENVDRLVLHSGETASLDEPYRLCAQCHFPQVDEWAAGAHGKRLDGWYGRRVVMNCTDCHDPHWPALEQRTPFPGPVLPRTRARR